MAALVDRDELLSACLDMLIALEAECYRENHSLIFNDAWTEFESLVYDLEAELNDNKS
jgi:hypothetical protein